MSSNRQMIVNHARRLTGSHYLWGSGGAKPDVSDGAWYRAGSVTLVPPVLDAMAPSVFAAQCSVDGLHICAGRYKKIPGGRQTQAGIQDVRLYLDGLSQLPQSMWQPYYGVFTPRTVVGYTVDRKIVWGEDCRDKRHFDCISFINYVLTNSTQPFWNGSIEQFRTNSAITTAINMDDPPVPGDLVFHGNDHIAFLCETGKVIQAQDHANGVHEDETYHPVHWSDRRRIPDALCWD